MTKLVVAFGNFAKAPKKFARIIKHKCSYNKEKETLHTKYGTTANIRYESHAVV
jgi:hypothetical protein